MNIDKAKALVRGSIVHCPADRGDKAFIGIVTHVSDEVYKNIYGVEYIWVGVKHKEGSVNNSGGWPSNRLG